MKTGNCTYKPIYKTDKVSQADIIEALDNFILRIERLKIKIDALYPADPCAFPFTMYISGKTGIPIKTEKFLKPENRILMLFSIYPDQIKKPGINFLNETFINEKIKIFRSRFPKSPSLLVAGNKHFKSVDIQLILFEKEEKINSYKFLSEAYRNYYFPVEGEFLHIDETFWNLSKKELNQFLKAKRIRDAAFSIGYDSLDEVNTFTPLEEDIDILIWEKLGKLQLSPVKTDLSDTHKPPLEIKYKKLLDIKNKEDNSVIVSILETISQSIEESFPVRLAYTNYEIVPENKVLIVPVAKEIVDGIELKIEISYKTPFKTDQQKLIATVQKTLKTIVKEILNKKTFRPYMEIVIDEEEESIRIYINWFLERKALDKLSRRINKKWLLSRLISRKQSVIRRNTLLKEIKNFVFSPESISTIFSLMESIWSENPIFFKASGNKIRESLEKYNIWYILGIYALKTAGEIRLDGVAGNKELLDFLLKLRKVENFHHFFATTDRYVFPVKTERIYRPNWERLIKNDGKIVLTHEVLNPETPVTYTLKDENGFFLGTVPKIISHYLAAKEESGYTLKTEKLYIDKVMFSNSSYWIEIKCLK
ncbi:hypothetical protein [Desulfurobacterium atlanticum]|uniref:Uncharacterized protein n=1 Tax=Desulfurobacterium atlanticum TaxID=240169 RepID=A0A238ZVJ2_9BACT|nr:hypothetical protein [Desulfurobacterium atlanticum]SNR87031.1 hypothetical protein SAMN06265340_11228 [Desulfurobacterium atlanticum]